jgi:ferric-dicitrate binding protein FerR (iron transport regulator)
MNSKIEMSNANNMEAYIVRYLHREITDEELRELETWLNETPANREAFFRLKNVHDLAQAHKSPSEEEIACSWRRMCRKMTEAPSSATVVDAPGRKFVPIRILKYVAAALAAGVISFAAGKYFGDFRQAEIIHPVAYHEICVEKGGRPNTVNLSDGSVVHLNAATTLRYPSEFNSGVREVYLDGEAWFEVAPNADLPFVVRLKQQSITVHGTSFNVESYHDESCNIVTLLTGSVSIEFADLNGVKIKNVNLVPGQKAHFDHTTGKVSIAQVDASLSNTWIQGDFRFKDEPLALIFKRLENYYNVTVHMEDEQLKNIRYTGTFSLQQHIRDVLRIINHENQFRFKQSGNEIYIKYKSHV